MKIELSSVPLVLVDYMEKTMLAKASGWQKAGIAVLMFGVNKRANDIMSDEAALSAMRMLGVLGKDNLVDVEFAHEMLTDAMEKSGGKLSAFGYVFDAADVEALIASAKIVKVPS